MNKCKCGCGQIVKLNNIFILGHNKSFLGKHHTKKSNKKNRIAHLGKRFSIATEIKKGQHKSSKTEFKKGHTFRLGLKHSKKTKEKLRKYYASKRIWKKCNICKKFISIIPSRINKNKIYFCSHLCSGKYHSKENCNKWKGGISKVNNRIRQSIKYKQWRQDVFIRDDFTCQKCGERGGKLHPHHKKSFAKLLQEVKQNLPLFDLYEAIMIYSPFWNIDNGETLCIECHKKTVNYGWKNLEAYQLKKELERKE